MSLSLRDVYHIRPSQAVVDMDPLHKRQLVDAAKAPDGEKKGLIITFDLSSSLRRTNNRLYTPRGQRDNVESWMTPYPKPILLQHNRQSDPIGRFIEVKWVANDDRAMKFFDSMQDFMDFKRVAETSNPRKIYKAMLKHNLLTNDSWPGIGRLVAKARISDPEAIEKFLDGRYMTFSAGSHTDSFACGQCGEDWAQGDVCEHTPGSISDEGLPGVHITGAFFGDEGSVVTVPGNGLSQLTSMEFGDAAGTSAFAAKDFAIDSANIQFTDAIVDIGDIMKTATDSIPVVDALKTMDPRDIARAIWDKTLTEEQVDALAATSHYETMWLVRIHDALHSEHDWHLRYDEEAEAVPDAVFTFHGDLHELSAEKGFRDSLINGPLDSFDKSGESSKEYVSPRLPTEDGEATKTTIELVRELLADAEAIELLRSALQETTDGVQETEDETSDSKEEEVEDKVEAEEEVTEDSAVAKSDEEISEEEMFCDADVDWYLLDAALGSELGDAKLSTEARDELEASQFCGPDRSFPVPDSAHVAAARRLIGRARLSDAEREKILAILDSKEESLNLVAAPEVQADCQCATLQTQLDAMTNDYQTSLALVTQLQDQLKMPDNTQDVLDKEVETDQTSSTTVLNPEGIRQVENPSASSADALAPLNRDLGDYEKKIVSTYKELRDAKGEAAASYFLRKRIARGHLPRSFDISPYIQENE